MPTTRLLTLHTDAWAEMSWFRDGLVVWKPVKAVLFNYGNYFFWIKGKLGLSEYQMAALAWLKGLILGFLLAYFL